jgi:uncharacterized protein
LPTKKTALIKPENYITPEIGLLGLKDIIKELENQDQSTQCKTIKDVKSGMILPGIVNNITNFGCFVDIGVKSGLVTSRSQAL